MTGTLFLFLAIIWAIIMGIFSPEEYFGGIYKNFKEKKPLYAWLRILAGLGALIIFLGAIWTATASFRDNRPATPFKGQVTIYSNIPAQETDIIDLDHSGKLTPAPNNFTAPFVVAPDGQCTPTSNEVLSYSQGIVLVLNVPTIFGTEKTYFMPPKASDYTIFRLGELHEIKTIDGRRFRLTLSSMKNLTTDENKVYGGYFSYTFDIIEI